MDGLIEWIEREHVWLDNPQSGWLTACAFDIFMNIK